MVPRELGGKYHLVHVRLLVLAVGNSDPRPMLRNLIKCSNQADIFNGMGLGYPRSHIKTADESLQTPALEELQRTVYFQGRQD